MVDLLFIIEKLELLPYCLKKAEILVLRLDSCKLAPSTPSQIIYGDLVETFEPYYRGYKNGINRMLLN